MRKIYQLIRGFAALILLAVSCQAKDILMGPYVNLPAAATARILWVSPYSGLEGSARWRQGGEKGRADSFKTPIEGRSEVLHAITVENLQPGALCHYEVSCGETKIKGHFTAPAPDESIIRFAVYGDTRSQPGKHQAVAEAIAAEKAGFVIHTGDLVARGAKWSLWPVEFFRPADALLRSAVFWPIRGNHEEDGLLYREFFDLPGNELYFSFDCGNLHFVVLDSNLQGRELEEMFQWLENDLAGTDAKWILVGCHHPTINIGGHASEWAFEKLQPLYEKYGVDIVLAGHSHLYERFQPIGTKGAKPVIHIVTGGGGAPLYEAASSPLLENGSGQSAYHYCLFSISGNTLTMEAKKPDGTLIDRLTLIKKEGRYQEEITAKTFVPDQALFIKRRFSPFTADYPHIPEVGKEMVLSARLEGLPDGSLFLTSPSRGNKWLVEEQKGRVQEGLLLLRVAPPDGFKAEPRYNPPLHGFSSLPIVDFHVVCENKEFDIKNSQVEVSSACLNRILPPPKPVFIPFAENITVDGEAEDWKGVRPFPAPFSNLDQSACKFAWNGSGLYGLVLAKDKRIEADVQKPWTADSFELFIDLTLERGFHMREHAVQYAFLPGTEGNTARLVAGVERGSPPVCRWRPTSQGYALEFHLPASCLAPAQAAPRQQIGLNFALNNGGHPVQQFYSDKNKHKGYANPFTWGIVHFSPPPPR